ncbi:T9SS type A sorting domain-containing protein [Paracrocinitomix mangrovi]|uniref:DUF7619 domain-containing protein n=1 Tax=Paracrocinitomix mangrovi TaxID=2862509 RepID=UPI001C8D1F68|nr:T9SS type A sorting domain-containing protein [Paracrocinitomix mangrovi]UKN02002.1 T9SS type A sorting domain-containing protein [Paracrocinitomix mangrovi]
MKNLRLLLLVFTLAIPLNNLFSQTISGTFATVPCDNDGVLDVTTTGLVPPIDYTYYLGGATITHPGVGSTSDQLTNIPMSSTGSIAIYATDGTNSAWNNVSYTSAFGFYLGSTNAVCPSTMGTLNATQFSGGAGPFSFLWTDTLTLNTLSGNNISAPLGNYSCVITDAGSGCVLDMTDSSTVSISQTSSVTATTSSTVASCTNGTATATGTGGVGPYTYLWMNGATSSTISGLTQNNYSVVVTDAQGCQSPTINIFVSQNPLISVNTTVTDASCVQNDGSIIAFGSGGVAPYTYAWSNGQNTNTASNLTGGSVYTVIATDANGCIGQSTSVVGTSSPISVTYSSTPSDCTTPNGSATLAPTGGTPPYTYQWNTTPVVNTATISNLSPGTYSFSVTDALGCVNNGSVVISPSSTINASIQSSNVVCPSTSGNVWVNVSGTNPPFTYLWNNAATSSQISTVPTGAYNCVITDANGCSITKYKTLSTTSPLTIGIATTPVSCIYNSDGGATASVFGGTPPYTYAYSNGGNSATVSGLSMGTQTVTVTDANGCIKTETFYIGNGNTTDDCYCTITGTVYLDGNSDCVFDTGEQGIQNVMVHCSGYGYTFTDANGVYSFQVPTGNFTITEQVNAYYPLSSCQATSTSVNVVAGSGCTTVVDISNDVNVINDLKITTCNLNIPPVPGNYWSQLMIVKNMGTVVENDIQLGYEHDGQLFYDNSTIPNFIQSGGPNHFGVQSGFPVLDPNASTTNLVSYNVPTNIPLGTGINHYDSVANAAPIGVNWLLDFTPWNNVNHFQTVVIGSYDPNYKEVYPAGIGTEGYISSDVTEFDYTIHFQNEGTYFAQNVVITDQLDGDLDWTSLTPGYSDHNYTMTLSESGLITFNFENINLPWKSVYGDALSSGLVQYSIRRLPSNAQGTVFENTASIYFDYNAPIITNTTVNTLSDSVFNGVEEIAVEKEDEKITVDIYPVPAHDAITFKINNVLQNDQASLYIVDMMGNIVRSERILLSEGTTFISQNVADLSPGNYITKVHFENGLTIVKKIILF